MTGKKATQAPTEEKLDALIGVTQDLLILQLLTAGINAGDVRKIVGVNTDRVSNISKYLNRVKRAS